MKKNCILIIITFVFLVGCSNQVFNGSRTSNDTQFILEYTILNDTKTHEMELQEGDTVDAVIENTSGTLDIFIEDINGIEVYSGNNATSEKIKLIIPKTSTYIFSVTGKKAKGSVSFIVTK